MAENYKKKRIVQWFLKKLSTELPYDPVIPLLGIEGLKAGTQTDAYTAVFTAALFPKVETIHQHHMNG